MDYLHEDVDDLIGGVGCRCRWWRWRTRENEEEEGAVTSPNGSRDGKRNRREGGGRTCGCSKLIVDYVGNDKKIEIILVVTYSKLTKKETMEGNVEREEEREG